LVQIHLAVQEPSSFQDFHGCPCLTLTFDPKNFKTFSAVLTRIMNICANCIQIPALRRPTERSPRRSTLGDRAFVVAGPRAWNSLPDAIRHNSSLAVFKRPLKHTSSRKVIIDSLHHIFVII